MLSSFLFQLFLQSQTALRLSLPSLSLLTYLSSSIALPRLACAFAVSNADSPCPRLSFRCIATAFHTLQCHSVDLLRSSFIALALSGIAENFALPLSAFAIFAKQSLSSALLCHRKTMFCFALAKLGCALLYRRQTELRPAIAVPRWAVPPPSQLCCALATHRNTDPCLCKHIASIAFPLLHHESPMQFAATPSMPLQ